MKKIYFLVATIFLCSMSYGQTWQWGKRGGALDTMYDTNLPEQVRSIVTDVQGNVFILANVGVTGLDIDGNPKDAYSTISGGASADYMIASFTCDGTYRWSKVIGGWRNDRCQRILLDSEGNVYVVGKFEAPVNNETGIHFDTNVIVPVTDYFANTNKQGLFVVKYSNEGTLQWYRTPQRPDIPYIESYTYGHSLDFSIDADGNLFWLVYVKEGVFGNGVYNATQEGYHIFKYNGAGDFLGGIPLNDMIYWGQYYNLKMSRNPSTGVIYFAAKLLVSEGETASFGGQSTNHNSFVVAYSATGQFLWLKQSSGTLIPAAGFTDISMDSNGDMYISGEARSGFEFGGHIFNAVTSATFPFILKLDPQGNVLWGTNSSSVSASTYTKAIVKGAMTGGGGNITWGNSSIIVSGSGYDMFMTRFNPETGEIIGLETILDDDGYPDFGTAISKDESGNIYVGGQMGHYLYVNSTTPLINDGPQSDFFIAKFGTANCTLGVNENTKTGLNFYPNPTRDRLTIAGQSNKKYTVVNALGQIVASGVIEGDDSIDVSSLSNGIYLLKVLGEKENQTIKFVKE